VTHAEAGAEVLTVDGDHLSVQPESDIEVMDTVGAGDAFTSVVIVGLVANWPLSITLRRAQQFASLIVGCRGATVSDRGFYREVMQDWEREN
jgi:fructokinase